MVRRGARLRGRVRAGQLARDGTCVRVRLCPVPRGQRARLAGERDEEQVVVLGFAGSGTGSLTSVGDDCDAYGKKRDAISPLTSAHTHDRRVERPESTPRSTRRVRRARLKSIISFSLQASWPASVPADMACAPPWGTNATSCPGLD
eukprot:7379620-Prymnesium_polylepis.1